jgi:hypothetical protein
LVLILFQDICRIFGAKTSDIFSHDESLIIGYSQILNPGYRRGPYRAAGGARGDSSPRTRVIRQYQYRCVLAVTLLRNFPRARVPRTSGIR